MIVPCILQFVIITYLFFYRIFQSIEEKSSTSQCIQETQKNEETPVKEVRHKFVVDIQNCILKC